jgi:hypothetical protein
MKGNSFLAMWLALASCGVEAPNDESLGSAQHLVAASAGNIPPGLPARLTVGLFEDTGQTWMKSSGVPWSVRYRYLTKGWANNWGYGAYDGGFSLAYMRECDAQASIPAFAYYQIFGEPGGAESATYAKLQNAATMKSYFGDFKLLMQRAKEFGKPVLVMLEADAFAFLQQQAAQNPNAYAAISASGMPELASLPNTVAGWGMAFLQLRKSVGASNAILGIHISGWASGVDLFHFSVTQSLEPHVDSVYKFLSPLGLAANQTGQSFDVLVGDPLDRDADFYRLTRGENRWWDPSDTAAINSKSFNRYAQWLRLWNVKASKRWVLWQIPIGNSSSLNVCNSGGARQGYKDNRSEYFFGASGATHRENFAAAGVISLLFGAGASCQASYQNDQDSSGQPYLKKNAGAFLAAGGLPLPSGSGTGAGSGTPADAGTSGGTGDSALYNFEASTQAWAPSGGLSAQVSSSTTRAYSGTHALWVRVNAAGAGTLMVTVASPPIPPGRTVTFHLWVPSGAPLASAQAFVQESSARNWRWTGSWKAASALTVNAWNTFSLTVPSDATELVTLGFELKTSAAFSGSAYIDSVGD